jgi:DNA-binding phage protein
MKSNGQANLGATSLKKVDQESNRTIHTFQSSQEDVRRIRPRHFQDEVLVELLADQAPDERFPTYVAQACQVAPPLRGLSRILSETGLERSSSLAAVRSEVCTVSASDAGERPR